MNKYNGISFRDLQILVQERGLKATGNREELIAKLEDLENPRKNIAGKEAVNITAKEAQQVFDRMDKMDKVLEAISNKLSPPDPGKRSVPKNIDKPTVGPSVIESPQVEDFNEIETDSKDPVAVVSTEPIVEKVEDTSIPNLTLRQYLQNIGLTYNELQNIVGVRISGGESNTEQLEQIQSQIDVGIAKAKKIVASGQTSIKVTNDIHLADALRQMGWVTMDINGSTHTMESPE